MIKGSIPEKCDTICPALVKSNDMMHVLTKSDIKEMMVPAIGRSRLTSANSLKDDGGSSPEESCCLMATSAMINPETRFTR
jgi:hypothetical protein